MLRFVRGLVGSCCAGLIQQLGVVEEQAMNPMKLIVEQVQGGTVWKGEGANAFVEEVQSISIPGVGQIGEHISFLNTNIKAAEEIMDRADEAVDRLIKGRLLDIFGFF